MGGSEDGGVYIWEREGGSKSTPTTSSIIPSNTNPTKAENPSPYLGASNSSTTSRVSPAYYPKPSLQPAHVALSGGTTVRPLKVLEGHGGEGAVFDVRYRAGVMVSAGEDGCVGVWEGEEEDEE